MIKPSSHLVPNATFMHSSLQNFMQYFTVFSVVVVCAFMCGSCETSADVTTFSSLQGRVIKTEYREKTITADNELDCVRSLCSGRCTNSAMSYNRQDRQCMSAPTNGWLIMWNPDTFTSIDPSWTTYFNKFSSEAVDRPSVLYLLDSVSKGTNLGSKGSQVNLIETGLTVWNAPGPRGVRSHLKYLISGASNRAEIPCKISAGSYLINFTGSFTVAAWVKTDTSAPRWMVIIDGAPGYHIPDFWFYGSKKQDQLLLGPKLFVHYYQSPLNSTGKQFWRHVAAVYKGFKDVQFYLNGSSFGQTINHASQNVFSLPENLRLGHGNGLFQFFGAMACVTIHERALSQTEVAALMTVCP